MENFINAFALTWVRSLCFYWARSLKFSGSKTPAIGIETEGGPRSAARCCCSCSRGHCSNWKPSAPCSSYCSNCHPQGGRVLRRATQQPATKPLTQNTLPSKEEVFLILLPFFSANKNYFAHTLFDRYRTTNCHKNGFVWSSLVSRSFLAFHNLFQTSF